MSRRRCCCGSGGGGGPNVCTTACAFCAPKRLLGPITVVDDNGTHTIPLEFASVTAGVQPWGFACAGNAGLATSDTLYFTGTRVSANPDPIEHGSCPSGPIAYAIGVAIHCGTGEMCVALATGEPSLLNVGPGGSPCCGYQFWQFAQLWHGDQRTAYACDGDHLTATVTFSDVDITPDGPCDPIPPPTYSLAISIPLVDDEAVCCQTFHATGCNDLDLSGVLVSVYDHEGGTLLAQGTTRSGGTIRLAWLGSCDVFVTATKCLFDDWSSSLSLTAGRTTEIPMTPVETGSCVEGRADPASEVLITVHACITGDPCEGATVLCGGVEYTTDASGQVTVTGSEGDPFTAQGCGSELYEGVLGDCGEAVDVYLACPTCALTVTVTGCNGLPLAEATVTAINADLVSVATGTTNSSGVAVLSVPAGPLLITVTCSRFTDWGEEVNYDDCPASHSLSAAMTVASGYHCIDDVAIPLKDTTVANDPVYPDCTLTYGGGKWSGSQSVTWPGNACCASHTFTISYEFRPDHSLIVRYGHHVPEVGFYNCPNGSSNLHAITDPILDHEYTPTGCGLAPGFLFAFTVAATPCPNTSGDDPYDMLYPSGGDLVITE